jgi:hypothetical protein
MPLATGSRQQRTKRTSLNQQLWLLFFLPFARDPISCGCKAQTPSVPPLRDDMVNQTAA